MAKRFLYTLLLTSLSAFLLITSTLHAQSADSESENIHFEFARVYIMNTQFFASNEIEEGTAIYSDGNFEDLAGQTMNEVLKTLSDGGWQMVSAARGGGDSYRAEFFYFQRVIKDD